ncbi:MAG: four helix bundle protein [Cyanobacteria bacterium J069]|nr:MAG: four helix bundle protein [Cyanobacteria bacterium J069]
MNSWRDLKAWQVAHELVLKTYSLTQDFPSGERFRLTDQLCRTAASIPTNIAEGKGRSSTKEYLHFLSIARGSVEEVSYLLLLARDLSYLPESTYVEMSTRYSEVGRMLNGLIRSLKQNLR